MQDISIQDIVQELYNQPLTPPAPPSDNLVNDDLPWNEPNLILQNLLEKYPGLEDILFESTVHATPRV